ncbi:Hsp20/alpha crystallin family protein [candidate division KSB1 bacterium]|nr:Hsp20/alpha crystallin family protein [candidate division KSB1 bacterium]
MYWRNLINATDPWQEMTRLQRDMNRLFDDFGTSTRRTFPAVNIWSNDEAVMITAELPGLDSNDIHLSVLDQNVVIEGNRRQAELKEGERYHRQERGIGEFKRTIQLPFPVNTENVNARVSNGILIVTLHRAEQDKPRKIEIKAS